MAEYSRPTLDFENCPLTVHAPATQEEMGEMVRAAAASGHAVYPVGGGTRLHLGLSPRRSGVVLATAGLNRVVDYPARDMTVTVELGMAVSTLRQLLAAEGQMTAQIPTMPLWVAYWPPTALAREGRAMAPPGIIF